MDDTFTVASDSIQAKRQTRIHCGFAQPNVSQGYDPRQLQCWQDLCRTAWGLSKSLSGQYSQPPSLVWPRPEVAHLGDERYYAAFLYWNDRQGCSNTRGQHAQVRSGTWCIDEICIKNGRFG
jgi:hypothetical protein